VLRSELLLKSIAGAISGGAVGIISILLGSPTEALSYILVVLYLIAYPVSVVIIRTIGLGVGIKRGVSVFYSIEFIFWVGTYEALSYFMPITR